MALFTAPTTTLNTRTSLRGELETTYHSSARAVAGNCGWRQTAWWKSARHIAVRSTLTGYFSRPTTPKEDKGRGFGYGLFALNAEFACTRTYNSDNFFACMSFSMVADERRVHACPRGPRGCLERRSRFSYQKARQLACWRDADGVASSSGNAPQCRCRQWCFGGALFRLLDATPHPPPQRANWRPFRYEKRGLRSKQPRGPRGRVHGACTRRPPAASVQDARA